MTPEMSALKTRLKTIWESGDYGVFAKYLEKGALGETTRVLSEYIVVIGGRA